MYTPKSRVLYVVADGGYYENTMGPGPFLISINESDPRFYDAAKFRGELFRTFSFHEAYNSPIRLIYEVSTA